MVSEMVSAMVNSTNLTDGLDGLASSVALVAALCTTVIAFCFADASSVLISAVMIGGMIAFLLFNHYPAKVFMGDTGSLSIGGIIAVFALCIRKELLLPLMCGIFLAEALSVMVQVGWFKYTKRKYGEGRRILLMSPLHHHYQKKGLFETKIVMRFFIVSILLCALTLVTLKIR